ncbi:Lipin/Ned1/Smp2-domain-containing protein [Gamsiella multidivaricata]|uniref:Lipin/Ned1/Smp2-domain-containing protein n=1 Tax=Gamsiella multidivaricata TaxID=101098 RepID=UPI002220F2A8|nr:Lipin/Ned1/Smp2-domain-containing protein [Gamsiella multidivaricata]KAG0355336.1 hypothetical protein BGZ54_001206 [Gamsiella multidivaricata]KAI7819949.1 Lipin/Ned1/Smp2-domain-containing protein [Gamsiella multidivaricata]
MQSVGSFFSSVTKFYSELNPATLSGAIDVVVVEQPNGDLACSPFHVRFGKLSILRPQEKVVEVTINGRVVDFPMKVGDAGEAFFVFETELDVPEEFATSPLAGPSADQVEEEIDYLDLAQEGGNTPTTAILPPEDLDNGYVSAHSGHSSEFEGDDQEGPSSEMAQRPGYPVTLKFDSFDDGYDLEDADLQNGQGRQRHEGRTTLKSRISISISLPCSPVLKAHDIMENFQPVVNSEGTLRNNSDSSNKMTQKDLLSPPKDELIMDMTGYKTDDSAESDLESDGPSTTQGEIKVRRRGRRRRTRVPRSLSGLTRHNVEKRSSGEHDRMNGHAAAASESDRTDPRLPARPIQHPSDRNLPSMHPKKRSSSLPNLGEQGEVKMSVSQKLATIIRPIPTKDTQSEINGSVSSDSQLRATPSSVLTPPSVPLQTSNHHSKRDEGDKTYPRRPIHKTNQPVQTKKSLPRSNPALNALSDTELEYQAPRSAKSAQETEWTWGWGSLPVKNDSVDDMSAANADQNVHGLDRHVSIDMESSPPPTAPKPVLNEMDIDGAVYRVAISLCPGDDFGKDLEASEVLFATHQISFDDFAKDPLKFLNNKSLVCLINDRYFTWAAAGPYLASLMLFRKPLSDETLHQLSVKDVRHLSDRTPAVPEPSTRFGVISRWFRGSQAIPSQADAMDQGLPLHPPPYSESATGRSSTVHETAEDTEKENSNGIYSGPAREALSSSTSLPIDTSITHSVLDEDDQQQTQPQAMQKKSNKRYAKTLRLTSEQLRSLNLKKGANTLTFSVTSSYQGKAVCSAKLFLWDHDFQVVISDIDGTITKSDALGHIFTMAGKDWTHTGVAKLYTDIANNGYHILYLTSRAIGQADYTRKYLKNVEQNNYQLPEGPVIMSPDRLMTAFHREVIMRKPEEFKMACLRDIRRLFGDRNPFYAGFGNRITDALSYRSVNVPSSRIFTIDSGGEVKLELLSSYKSSYLALNDLVNEIFPGKRHAPEFNDWNYWKAPLPSIELPMAPSHQPVLPQAPVDINTYSKSSRLGVIRSFTSSFTSGASGKRRPSIPTFNSAPQTPPSANSSFVSQLSPRLTSSSPPPFPSSYNPAAVTPPLSPPVSASGGLQIAERTRRLSTSLMKYGAQSVLTSPALSSSASNVNPFDKHSGPSSGTATAAAITESSIGNQGKRARGMSMTSTSAYIPSNLGTSPPTSFNSSHPPGTMNAEDVHPLDIQVEKKAPSSGFSVSPPQIASRFTETVIPFLRGSRTSKSEQGQSQDQDATGALLQDAYAETSEGVSADQILSGSFDDYAEGPYEDEDGDEEDGGEYEDEYGEDEEEDLDDVDVELDIDAPFL